MVGVTYTSSHGRPTLMKRRPGMSPLTFLQKRNPTLWIGMLMFVLAFAYLSVVVFVTKQNLATNPADGGAGLDIKPSSSTNGGESLAAAASKKNKVTYKDVLREAEVKKSQKEQQGKLIRTRIKNIRRHHLELEFGAGVQPHKLAEVDPEDAPVMFTNDPPIDQHPTPNNVLQAYLEPLNYDDWKIQPLPIRTNAKSELLKKVTYTRLSSCSKLTQQWPTDDPPTDVDPFLPWIHDVFPTADGKYIQIVAQNKRRCKTGSKERDILAHMGPQAALFQHISLKRVNDNDGKQGSTRYRLASHEDADPDALATRFICRFKPSMEETLSEYNFDYDWTSFRKRYKVSFAEDEGGIKQIHTTQLIFRCPVPESLRDTIRTGASVQNDWATLFVDVIPVRTAPRWGKPNQYFAPRYREFEENDPTVRFDPDQTWGKDHILPRIEDSGRWENIPICKPSLMTYEAVDSDDNEEEEEPNDASLVAPRDEPPPNRHRLVSCLWASSGYTTRGNRFAVNDGQRRLLEWLQYNMIIGFDHFYVYDNSGAFGPDSSLKPITDLFPDKVTYIPWPAKICNNNPNNVDSVGERSSQYAAESSCRLRFGPHVQWIGQFDIDEYLVPMGSHNNITSLLDELEKEDTRVISFNSWRAWPRWKFVEEPVPIHDKQICWSADPCFDLRIPLQYTMLQAYNCDRQKPGQKTSTMPAEKQLYRADYVLQHFVHYSAVTTLSEKNRTEYENEGFSWKRRPFPDARQRFANELTEGLMIHTKAVARQDTAGWQRVCSIDHVNLPKHSRGLCRLGVPWPEDAADRSPTNGTADGWAYNCYVNEKVEQLYVPQLDAKLRNYAHLFDQDEKQPQQQ